MYEYDDYSGYSYGGYGHADFSTASHEAYQLSWDAYNAGDMDASYAWNEISQNNWTTSVDLYANGADSYGTESPSSSAGYYGEYGAFNPSGTDYSYSSSDYSSYDSSSYYTADTSSSYASTDYSSSYSSSDYSSSYSTDYTSSYSSDYSSSYSSE